MRALLAFFLFLAANPLNAQETHPVNGVADPDHLYHAFTEATIHIKPGVVIPQGTLLIKDGKIIAASPALELPQGTVVHPCAGSHIYASFIDLDAGVLVKKRGKDERKTAADVHAATNWNPAIQPERTFIPTFPVDQKAQDDWLAGGIGVVNTHERDGIMRGSAALFHLGIDQANEALIRPISTFHYSFSKGSSANDYPSSHMGAIALFRQTMYDASWYAQSLERKEVNRSLAALSGWQEKTNVFELNHPLSYRNIQDLNQEFGANFILKGTGKEYLVASNMNPGTRLIIPVQFPKAFDIKDPLDARMISLEDLKHWEAAPYNAYFLLTAGHRVAISRDTIRSHKTFLSGLHKLSTSGMGHDDLLRALTTTPAEFIGMDSELGSLEAGKMANFFLSDNPIGSRSFRVLAHWTRGKEVFRASPNLTERIGTYNLVVDGVDFELNLLSVSEKGVKVDIASPDSDTKYTASLSFANELLTLVVWEGEDKTLLYQLSGKLSLGGSLMDGTGTNREGQWITWAGIRDRKHKSTDGSAPLIDTNLQVPQLRFPNKAYGWSALPTENSFVITNAVVWTSAQDGILEQADVWVEHGKIKAVGSGALYPSGLRRIDAKGRHLTPGLIDEHSHIGIRGGVNEWARSSSAEVRISDSVDPWSIHIYRQLAGGVTSAQLLHGSANPIGGQSALIKLKWGVSAEELLIKDAPGFIKFALGENVKRSNSRDPKGRFPLTRMGVEQTFVDAFTRAEHYRLIRQRPTSLTPARKVLSSPPVFAARRDLQLDAMVEILDSTRFISCHSYVQSEVLMLMSVADSFGFKVNTFTHILEGYKVAKEMADHGVGGSTFSDWWAYKFEVNDAIPYNAALMHQAGVVVAINSDDAEMGRRLNQEAAKTMKYGGISREDALKMITINPAKLLHLDGRTGSIEVGKDADLVLWSADPLSVYAHADMTFIEGIKYFDYSEQADHLRFLEHERARIIALMLADPSQEKEEIKSKAKAQYHCDTILEQYDQE